MEKQLHELTISELRIEETLCYKLDSDIYLPVKEELKGINKTYSLGMRKEDFKGTIESELKKLKSWAVAIVKEIDKITLTQICHYYGPDYVQVVMSKMGIRAFLMEKFEIKLEDLK